MGKNEEDYKASGDKQKLISFSRAAWIALIFVCFRQKCTTYNLQYNTLLLASARFVVLLCALLLLIVTVKFHVAYQKYQMD